MKKFNHANPFLAVAKGQRVILKFFGRFGWLTPATIYFKDREKFSSCLRIRKACIRGDSLTSQSPLSGVRTGYTWRTPRSDYLPSLPGSLPKNSWGQTPGNSSWASFSAFDGWCSKTGACFSALGPHRKAPLSLFKPSWTFSRIYTMRKILPRYGCVRSFHSIRFEEQLAWNVERFTREIVRFAAHTGIRRIRDSDDDFICFWRF